MNDRSQPAKPSARSQNKARVWLIGTQLLAAVTFVVPVFFLLGMLLGNSDPAVFFFSDFSGTDPLPARYTMLLLVLTLLGLPLSVFSAAYAWRLFAQDQYKQASLVSAIPVVYLGLSSCLLPYLVMLFFVLRS